MTVADLIIVGVVALVVGLMIYRMVRSKDRGICEKCAYAKSCDDFCIPKKKTDIR